MAAANPLAAQAQLPPQSQAAAQVNRIVAVVNGEVVSRADVVGRARLFALNAGLPWRRRRWSGWRRRSPGW
ncbi:hypothetical protein ACFQU2_17795 [Siccirubricoccus deserti]